MPKSFLIEETCTYKVEAEDEDDALEKFLDLKNPTIEVVFRDVYVHDDHEANKPIQ